MAFKFSKIDIGSVKKIPKPEKKPRNIPKRMVLASELRFARRPQVAKPEVVIEKPRIKKTNNNFSKNFSFAFAGIILILVLQAASYFSSANSAKGEILGVATSAYSQLGLASQDLVDSKFSSAVTLFDSAQKNIKSAQEKLNAFSALKWLAPQANSADHILNGASRLALAGQKLSVALSLFDDLKVSSKGVETSNFNEKIFTSRQLLLQTQELVSA